MTRDAYWQLLYPSPDYSREYRRLLRLRAFLICWVIFVAGVFFPPIWLLVLAVPSYLRGYRQRLERGPGRIARTAQRSEAMFRAGW